MPLAEKRLEVPQGLIRTALDLELQEGSVVADRVGETPCVFLAGLYRAERTIAERLKRLANGTLPWPRIYQGRLTPLCGGHAPSAERTVGPARLIVESLTPRPGNMRRQLLS